MGNFGAVTQVNQVGRVRGEVRIGGWSFDPLQLGSEFVVALIVLAVLYVGAEEFESCIDLRMMFSEQM